MYHNIMDIDIDCPKPKVGLCGPSEDRSLNILNLFRIYFLNAFFLNLFKKLNWFFYFLLFLLYFVIHSKLSRIRLEDD